MVDSRSKIPKKPLGMDHHYSIASAKGEHKWLLCPYCVFLKRKPEKKLVSTSPRHWVMRTHPHHPLGGAINGSSFEIVLSSANRATTLTGFDESIDLTPIPRSSSSPSILNNPIQIMSPNLVAGKDSSISHPTKELEFDPSVANSTLRHWAEIKTKIGNDMHSICTNWPLTDQKIIDLEETIFIMASPWNVDCKNAAKALQMLNFPQKDRSLNQRAKNMLRPQNEHWKISVHNWPLMTRNSTTVNDRCVGWKRKWRCYNSHRWMMPKWTPVRGASRNQRWIVASGKRIAEATPTTWSHAWRQCWRWENY